MEKNAESERERERERGEGRERERERERGEIIIPSSNLNYSLSFHNIALFFYGNEKQIIINNINRYMKIYKKILIKIF